MTRCTDQGQIAPMNPVHPRASSPNSPDSSEAAVGRQTMKGNGQTPKGSSRMSLTRYVIGTAWESMNDTYPLLKSYFAQKWSAMRHGGVILVLYAEVGWD